MRNDVKLVRGTAVAAMTLFLLAGAALAADGLIGPRRGDKGQDQPISSSETASPSETTEPAMAAEPAETAEPAKAAEPAETADPAKAAEPAETADPAKADEPAKAAEPAETAEPAADNGSDAAGATNDHGESSGHESGRSSVNGGSGARGNGRGAD